MDKELSERIDIAKFLLVIAVVFIHANTTAVVLANGEIGLRQAGIISI
ncbi:hypothetical protein ACFL6P_07500 [Candidatus Latescibacterota bacterium]